MQNNPKIAVLISIFAIGILQFILPWWIGAVILFAVGTLMLNNAGQSFAVGLIAMGIVWLLTALFQTMGTTISVANGLGELFGGLPGFSIYIITALIGGVLGGMASLTGTFARQLVINKGVSSK